MLNMDGKEALDSSFDSKEDYELYMRLMNERQKLQRQMEDKKRQTKAAKVRQVQAQKLEEREKGFQLYVSGANEERIEEARRRQQQLQADRRSFRPVPAASAGAVGSGKEWQVETVELRGKDGELYRCSPHHGYPLATASAKTSSPEVAPHDEDEIDEELPDSGNEWQDDCGSRPSTGGSVSGLDQDMRGVLRMMNTASNDQLSLLRESLSNQIDRKVPAAGSGLPSSKLSLARPSSANSRPQSSSSTAAIASAIQAENARVRRLSEGGSAESIEVAVAGGSRPSSGDASRIGQRPSSKASRRLPLSAEDAAEFAPPSVLGFAGNSRSLPSAISASGSGYPCPAVSSSLPQAPGPPMPWPVTSTPSSSSTSLPVSLQVSTAIPSKKDARGVSEEIVDRVGRLDRRKQKALLRVLETLEVLDDPLATTFSPSPSVPATTSTPASPAKPVLSSDVATNNGVRVLRIRVLSSWGDLRQCGLSLIEFILLSSELLRLPPAALFVHGTQGGSTTLGRVLEGKGNATDERSMWLAKTAPKTPGFDPFEINITIPTSMALPAGLRIWNFNSREGGLAKGAREIEVWQGDQLCWSGELPIGTGDASIRPAFIALQPGFTGAPISCSEDVSLDSSPLRPKDKPIWMDGVQGIPVRDDLDDDEELEGISDSFQASPKQKGRSITSNDEAELMQSLQALEQFRSSQSRRFFAGCRPRGESQAQTAEDWRAPITQSHPSGSSNGLQPSVSQASSPAPLQTAHFGGPSAMTEDVMTEALLFEDMDIPVRNFDDFDALDGFVCNDPPNIMGSSLFGNQFDPMQSVVIPTLPSGRSLVFNCLSTWGDQNFVGLAGIEIFDGRGFPVVMKDAKRQVTADPYSINDLPEYVHDPRTPDKLFDQVNLTRDDLHVWLAPFSPGRSHTITVDLERKTEISMIRVWNYNKSRLHSSRGVRDLEVFLDGQAIFTGEVRRAPGVLTAPEEACEHILFTQDDSVLEAVEEHDWLPAYLPVDSDGEDLQDELDGAMPEALLRRDARPPTADIKAGRIPSSPRGETTPRTAADGRPLTRANVDRPRARGTVCSSVTIVIHSTWGDQFYVGLTALEVLNASLTAIPLTERMIDAYPRDLNDLQGVDGDIRTLDKLLDGVGCTSDDAHMWLAPFLKATSSSAKGFSGSHLEPEASRNLIRIDFTEPREVAGFNLWNYNKNVEDTCRGVKEFSVYCDDRFIATFLCRKAPGHVHFDFKQVVLLDQPPCADSNVRRTGIPSVAPRMPSRGPAERPSSRNGRPPSGTEKRPPSRERAIGSTAKPESALLRTPSAGLLLDAQIRLQQQYETPLHPCGFIFKLLLLSTWNDVHYIGLDGIELYDLQGKPLRPKRAHSNHGSVRNLQGMEADIRTEETFLKGCPFPASRMWLAPFCRQAPNYVELIFDEPTQISYIKFWNYSRTPARGVRDVELYVDDLLIYQGVLKQANAHGSSPPSTNLDRATPSGEAVLFTLHPEIVERERSLVYLPSPDELVAFFDDSGRVDSKLGRPGLPSGLSAERPMTALLAR